MRGRERGGDELGMGVFRSKCSVGRLPAIGGGLDFCYGADANGIANGTGLGGAAIGAELSTNVIYLG